MITKTMMMTTMMTMRMTKTMMTTIMTKTMIIMMIWIINVVRPSFQNCATYLSICQKDSFLPSSVVGCFVFREASFSVLS